MKFTLALIAAILISLAWLMPVHYRPWVTYTGELYAFFALFSLAAIFLRGKLRIPVVNLPLLLLACVPLIQFLMGQVFFFSTAMMGFIFVFSFWLASVLGYNLSTGNYNREETFTNLSYVFLASGTVTGMIANLPMDESGFNIASHGEYPWYSTALCQLRPSPIIWQLF